MKKGKLRNLHFMVLLRNWFKRYAKVWAVLPSHLDTALSNMSWILVSNSWTSEAEITPQLEPCREVTVSTMAALCLSGMNSCINVNQKIRKALISYPIGRIQSDVIQWCRSPDSKWWLMTGIIMSQLRGWHLACLWYRQK